MLHFASQLEQTGKEFGLHLLRKPVVVDIHVFTLVVGFPSAVSTSRWVLWGYYCWLFTLQSLGLYHTITGGITTLYRIFIANLWEDIDH